MACFARFLIDNGLASEGAVLEALVRHVESQPPLCAIVRRESLLSLTDQLRVLEHQEAHACGYREALTQLDLWTEPLAGRLAELASAAAQPFADLLLRTGALGPAELNLAFDEFVGQAPTGARLDKLATKDAKPVKRDTATRYDQGMSQAFLELFDDSRRQRTETLVARWRSDPSADLLRSIVAEWGPLRAGARFLGNGSLEALLSEGTKALLAVAARALPAAPDDGAVVAALVLEILELSWTLARTPSASEQDSNKDSVDMRRIELVLTKARALQAPIQHGDGDLDP